MNTEATMLEKLNKQFSPEHIELVNESNNHNVPANSETHFKLTLVDDFFTGKSLVKRHQAVYALLNQELAGPVHALALHLYTKKEWAKLDDSRDSPDCMGGDKA